MALNYYSPKKSNAQQACAYILYMIIGSYFHKCICMSEAAALNLFLYYKEMEPNKQIQKEMEVIQYLEKHFREELNCFSDLNCEAHIIRFQNHYRIIFYTGFEGMIVTVTEKGKYSVKYYSAANLDCKD